MTQFKEFKDIEIPTVLDNAAWEDVSWHNDATASLQEIVDSDFFVQVWVNSDDVSLRECWPDHKYAIIIYNQQTGDTMGEEITANNDAELLAAIETQRAVIIKSWEIE